MSNYIIEARNIVKNYGGVIALDDAEFLCPEGRIVGLLGENGSGKTTLSRIITGIIQPSSGRLLFNGRKVNFSSPKKAEEAGIGIIHQNFSLVPDLSVGENLYLGNEPSGRMGVVNNAKIRENAEFYLNRLCPWINQNRIVNKLLPAEQQLVEITKALTRNPQFLILDEPTAALEREQVDKLFNLMKELKNNGVSMVFISHRMHEVEEICDHVVVLRNGKTVGKVDFSDKSNLDYDTIVKLITGQSVIDANKNFVPNSVQEEFIMEAENLGDDNKLSGINFKIQKGEIVGLAGLQGQGQDELMLMLSGFKRIRKGNLIINKKKVKIKNPKNAINNGLALVPGNRQTQGLFMELPILHNLLLIHNIRKDGPWILNMRKMIEKASSLVDRLSVKVESLSLHVSSLSGGNAQKVVVAKWLPLEPKVLLLSDPAKGIDVQAKAELYSLISDLADSGISSLVYASDLNELLHVCNRILIMYEGRIVEDLGNTGLDEEKLMSHCIRLNDSNNGETEETEYEHA